MKKCNKCSTEYESSPLFFKRDRTKKDGLNTICKVCAKENNKRHYCANKKRYLEWSNSWSKNNRVAKLNIQKKWNSKNIDRHWAIVKCDSASKKSKNIGCIDTLTINQLLDKYSRNNGYCEYCSRIVYPKTKLSVDHVIPFNRGGVNTIENVALCCRSCNSKKRDNSLEQFKAYMGFP